MGRSPRTTEDGGAAAVEFALVSVLLLTLLFGIIQYSYFFYQSQGLASTARELSRLAAVGVTKCELFRDAAAARADANGTPLTDPASSLNLVFIEESPERTKVASVRVGDVAEVSITWQMTDFGLPFVPFLDGPLTETAQTRVESVGDSAVTAC